QIRLNLAKALASDPDLLLLDEPTNYLDIVSVRWLKRFLCNWKNELMLITHDRDFMDSVTTHTMAVYRHKIRKVPGPTHKLYAQIAQEEEIYEKTRQNDEKKRKEIEVFINRFRASATKASSVQSRVKALDRTQRLEKLKEARTLDFEFNSAPFPGKFLIEVRDLTFGFDGDNPLIRDLSLSVGKDDRIAIIGKNGRGKTTLLNLLAGEIESASGSINRHAALRLAYFGQTNVSRLNLKNTVEQEIMEAHPDFNRAASRKVCGAMMFERDKALKKIEVLSGGERSRVLLGKILVSPANLLLLDEPTNHLDMDSIDALIEAIDAFSGAVIIVTHSELILDAVATRLVVFDGGSVSLFEGSYRDFLDKVGWEGEADAKAAKKKADEVKPLNKKELRKLKAEAVSERNSTLGPLKSRMSEVEKAIIEGEKDAEELSRALLGASENGEADKIAALSRAYHASRGKIDALFDELVKLSADYDRRSKEFDERLRGL
ncbi:MAG: ABC-F family ATP-binding cassette domain-containing protein, partial [Deltaproteobacteria bacterium]